MTIRTRRHPATLVRSDHPPLVTQETVLVEAPLTVVLDGVPVTTTLRTPGHDLDLTFGLLFALGYIAEAAHIRSLTPCRGTPLAQRGTSAPPSEPTRIQVTRHDGARSLVGQARLHLATSACGACSSDEVIASQPAFPAGQARTDIPTTTLQEAVEAMASRQTLFHTTGGCHGAALVDEHGSMLVVREDVGRHNAVDKVLGWALREGVLPQTPLVLAVSSRVGFEIVDKAVRAGVTHVAAVSAPTSMALELAERHGLIVAGFTRPGRITIYGSSPEIVQA